MSVEIDVKSSLKTMRHFKISLTQLVVTAGIVSFILGTVVLLGWYSHNPRLIQINSIFVPMQYNTALCFFLSGAVLILLQIKRKNISGLLGSVVLLIGLITLLEYIFGIDLFLDQLFMEHYITVHTSTPGRMAPNTALCFTLTGFAALYYALFYRQRNMSATIGIVGALIFGLGLVAFTGYFLNMEAAYGWGKLTRMAIHTAAGFIIIGFGYIFLSWSLDKVTTSNLPRWLPLHVLIVGLTFTISIWQAFHVHEMKITALFGSEFASFSDEGILMFGVLMSVALAISIKMIMIARLRIAEALEANKLYREEFEERQRAEDELRESEEKYRTLFERESDAIFISDPDTFKIIEANEATSIMYGYDKDELIGMSCLKFSAEAERSTDASERIREDGKVSVQHRLHRKKDGTIFPVDINGYAITLGDNKVMFAVSKDISERIQAEEDRKKLEIHMRQQQKLESIGTLASGIAHEINNPINGIMNYAQLINDRLDQDSPLKEFAIEIGKETERVAVIVRNLLTFSRDEKETHSPADIQDIVDDTISLVQTIIRHDQITLELDIPDDLPKIRCRSQQIQQVLMNLLTNARDALNERYPEFDEDKIMSIKVRPFEKDNIEWIRMTVEDHGVGIKDDIRDRIFDPFFTTKDRTKGTGLGLSISYGIIEDHNGEMQVESEPGQYTCFHVDLRVNNDWTVEKS